MSVSSLSLLTECTREDVINAARKGEKYNRNAVSNGVKRSVTASVNKGYVIIKDDGTLALGPKAIEDDAGDVEAAEAALVRWHAGDRSKETTWVLIQAGKLVVSLASDVKPAKPAK